MGHPIRFDDTNPLLRRVREIALGFPDAAEKISHGHPAFFTTKVFTYYGGSIKVDGEWERYDDSLLVLLDPDERDALADDPRCYLPAYLAPSGWLGMHLGDDTDWAEVTELIDASYRLTAGPRRIARLDAQAL